MLVVIKPSTGDILAVAQNAAADVTDRRPTMGSYPPGSTFKIVTAGAAIDRDMATPNTLLGCPGTPISATGLCRTTQVRPRHCSDGQGIREFLQHHLRRAGQSDHPRALTQQPPSTASGRTT